MVRHGGGADASDQEFGALLRSYRALANLTQEDLADRSGLSVHAISMLERGVRRSPRSSTVEFLAGALELDAAARRVLIAAAQRRSPPALVPPAAALEPFAGVPPDPVACFVGREAELAELHRLLDRSGRVAVSGMGGVGKTQLVVRYLHRHRARYPDGTFWLRAERSSSLLSDLASLGTRLGLPIRELAEHQRQAEEVLRWLRGHHRWLLVLDNLEPDNPDVAEAASVWLPPGLAGHVVVTSRTPTWPTHLALGVLPPEVAVHYLLERTGQPDPSAARMVAELLGCLPLALAQAAAYLVRSGRALDSYARLLGTRLVELMEDGGSEDHPHSVASTLRLSYERVAQEHPAGAALLRVCAFLAPEDVPESLLRDGVGELPVPLRAAVTDELAFDRTVSALRRYSLLDRRADGLWIHRLTQAVVRAALPDADRDAHLACAIRVLGRFPDDPAEHPERWPLAARLLPHALAVGQLAGAGTTEPAALGRLLDRAGLYLAVRGNFGQAQRLLERALRVREQALGPEHPETAASLNSLGLVLGQQGQLAAARQYLDRSLAVRERVLGHDHPATAESLNDVASLLRQQGEGTAARPLYERALAIRERALGADHLRTANILNNMANLQRDQGDLGAARPLLERALAICERVLGPEHPYTALVGSNLGWLVLQQGDLGVSRSLLERALAVREQLLGPDHPQTARTRQHLAEVILDERGAIAARPLLERVLAVYERALTPDHSWLMECRVALARLSDPAGDRTPPAVVASSPP